MDQPSEISLTHIVDHLADHPSCNRNTAPCSVVQDIALGVMGRPAGIDMPAPVLAMISHPVADYAHWRAVYDAAAPLRASAGVTSAEVFTDAANPGVVVVIHRFPTIKAAKAFFRNPALASAMQQGGVTAPPKVTIAVTA